MRSIKISVVKRMFGENTESKRLVRIAHKFKCYRIYKYANNDGDKATHTDYERIQSESDEKELLSNNAVHNVVLVYDRGKIVNQKMKLKKWWQFWKSQPGARKISSV